MPHPIFANDDLTARAWAFDVASKMSGIFAPTLEAILETASKIEDYVLTGARPASFLNTGRVDPHGSLSDAVNGLNDIPEQIQNVSSVDNNLSIAALQFNDLIEVKPDGILSGMAVNSIHNSSPVSGLDTETVAETGGGVNAPAGKAE